MFPQDRFPEPTRPAPPQSSARPTHPPPPAQHRALTRGPALARNLSARRVGKPEILTGNPCADWPLPRSPIFPGPTALHSDPGSFPHGVQAGSIPKSCRDLCSRRRRPVRKPRWRGCGTAGRRPLRMRRRGPRTAFPGGPGPPSPGRRTWQTRAEPRLADGFSERVPRAGQTVWTITGLT